MGQAQALKVQGSGPLCFCRDQQLNGDESGEPGRGLEDFGVAGTAQHLPVPKDLHADEQPSGASHHDGQTHDGLPHGCGRQRWLDGSTYDGEFHTGLRHGRGRLVWASGCTYVGDFHADEMHGQGDYVWTDGRRYSGQWTRNTLGPCGRVWTLDSSLYEGELLAGQRHGVGSLWAPDGSRYVGQWRDGRRHGTATLCSSTGLRRSSAWRDGRFIQWLGPPMPVVSKRGLTTNMPAVRPLAFDAEPEGLLEIVEPAIVDLVDVRARGAAGSGRRTLAAAAAMLPQAGAGLPMLAEEDPPRSRSKSAVPRCGPAGQQPPADLPGPWAPAEGRGRGAEGQPPDPTPPEPAGPVPPAAGDDGLAGVAEGGGCEAV